MTPTLPHALPDYCGGSLVNLMRSVAAALGTDTPYPPLAALPPAALAGARHLVLLVVDGLGLDFLLGHEGALRRHLRGQLTSVFPSTTASAIPVFLTGLAPQQHGLTGWHMYFREIGAVAAPLPFRLRTGRHSVRDAGVTPAQLFGLTPLFDRLPVACHVVSPQQIIDSDFNVALSGRAQRHGYQTLDELFGVLAGLVQSTAPRSYVYAYWSQLDSLAHEYGIASPQAAAAFATLDAAFARLLDAAHGTGSVILVTADHGFIDCDETIDLDDHPALRDTLRLPLCGEPRASFAYVREGQAQRFQDYVHTRLAGLVDVLPSEAVLNQGWFGAGATHPRLTDRIGDYLLLPRGQAILRDWLVGETRHVHIGVHGGVSTASTTMGAMREPTPRTYRRPRRCQRCGNDRAARRRGDGCVSGAAAAQQPGGRVRDGLSRAP
ncbi:MAG: alkaline phosphatase family protein [Thiobacillus sp.]